MRQPRAVGRKHRSPEEVGGCTPAKWGRRHTPGSYAAPSRRSNRLGGLKATRATPVSPSDSAAVSVTDVLMSEFVVFVREPPSASTT